MRHIGLTLALVLGAATSAGADARLPFGPSREAVERIAAGTARADGVQVAQATQPAAPKKAPPRPAPQKPGTPTAAPAAGKTPGNPAPAPSVQTQTGRAPVPRPVAKPPVRPVAAPVDPDAVKRGPFIEPRPGFFLGKGSLRGFRGELAGGFYPGWLKGAFAFVFQAGYYGASAEQTQNDPDIGVITRSWQMTAIPVGATARWFLTSGAVQPYVVGGIDYTRVTFRYDAKIAAGPLQEPRETGLNAAGPRGGAGVAMNLGPGVLDGELALTHAFLPSDPKGTPGRIYAPVVFAGYAYVF